MVLSSSKPGCGTDQEKGKLGLTPCLGSHAGSTNCLETFKKKISVKSNCSFSLMPSAVPFCLYLFQIFFQVFAKRCVDREQPLPGRVFSRSWPCGGISHWGVLKEILLPDRTERVSPCRAGLSTSHLSCECPRAPLGVQQPSSGMALPAGCSISPVGSLPPPNSLTHQRRVQTHTAPQGLVSLPSEWAYQFILRL